MWRIFVNFVATRLLFLGIAYFLLNQALIVQAHRNRSETPFLPSSLFVESLTNGLCDTSLLAEVEHQRSLPVFTALASTKNPYLWVCRLVAIPFRWTSALLMCLVSTFFTLLFLWEFYSLCRGVVAKESAIYATLFLLLWPTSYLLSGGTALSLLCFSTALLLRKLIDKNWKEAGMLQGLVLLLHPSAFGFYLPSAWHLWSLSRREHWLPRHQGAAWAGYLLPSAIVLLFRPRLLPLAYEKMQHSFGFHLFTQSRGQF